MGKESIINEKSLFQVQVNKKLRQLASEITKEEIYKGTKNPRKPQVSIGDMREIQSLYAVKMYQDPEFAVAMFHHGKQLVEKKLAKVKK